MRASAVWVAVALGLFATLAMQPVMSKPGPHMSPRLTMVKEPALASVAPGAVHQDCLFTPLFGVSCYGPADLAKAYNFPAGLDGSGQTIVIVDAYGSQTLAGDLAFFDAYYQVPAPPSLTVINVPGTGVTGSGALTSWQVETSLDVEYAHAIDRK